MHHEKFSDSSIYSRCGATVPYLFFCPCLQFSLSPDLYFKCQDITVLWDKCLFHLTFRWPWSSSYLLMTLIIIWPSDDFHHRLAFRWHWPCYSMACNFCERIHFFVKHMNCFHVLASGERWFQMRKGDRSRDLQ